MGLENINIYQIVIQLKHKSINTIKAILIVLGIKGK